MLIKCTDCGTEVSDYARACPKCGRGIVGPKTGLPLNATPMQFWGCLAPLGLFLVLLTVYALVNSDGTGGGSARSTAARSTPVVVDTAAQRKAAEARAADSLAAVRRFAELSPRFKFEQDEVEGGGWYTARAQLPGALWNATYLAVYVNADGFAYLASHYYGDDWIFHEQIVVRIGDQIRRSETVPSYDESNHRNNSGGSVWESLHFSRNRDNGILTAIAQTGKDTPIMVRLEGDQHARDFRLSARDRQAIREGVELGQLLTTWPSLRRAAKK